MLPHKRSGFTLLYIDDREEYIENVAVMLFLPQTTLSTLSTVSSTQLPPSTSSSTPSQQQQPLLRALPHPIFPTQLTTHVGLSGRLHICSKSLYFASDDQRHPIVKFPFQHLVQYTPHIYTDDAYPTDTLIAESNTNLYSSSSRQHNNLESSIQTNDPYLFFITNQLISFYPNSPQNPIPLDTKSIQSEFLIYGAHGHNLIQFIKLMKKLFDIEQLRFSSKPSHLLIHTPASANPSPSSSNLTTHREQGHLNQQLDAKHPQPPRQQPQPIKKQEKKEEGLFGGLFGGFFGNNNDTKAQIEKKKQQEELRKKREITPEYSHQQQQQRKDLQHQSSSHSNNQHHHNMSKLNHTSIASIDHRFDMSADELLKAFLQARQLSIPFDISLITDLHETPLLTLSTFESFYIHVMCCQLGFEPPQSMFYNPSLPSNQPNQHRNRNPSTSQSSTTTTTTSMLSSQPLQLPSSTPNSSTPSPSHTPSHTPSSSTTSSYLPSSHHIQNKSSSSPTPQSSSSSSSFSSLPLTKKRYTNNDQQQHTVESIDRHIITMTQLSNVPNIDTLFNHCRRIQTYFTQSKSILEKSSSAATIVVNLITPLVQVPGRLYLTTQKLYYIPFNDISADTHCIPLNNVIFLHKRRYASREIGLEIMLKSSCPATNSSASSSSSSTAYGNDYSTMSMSGNNSHNDANNNSSMMSNLFYNTSSVYIIVENQFVRDLLYEIITKQDIYQQHNHPTLDSCIASWLTGQISNFDYLLLLNHFSGRSLSDLSQYPVMPWVLSNYESYTLDLNDSNNYRDLSKPVGALNSTRLESFRQRYSSMVSLQDHQFDMDLMDPHASYHQQQQQQQQQPGAPTTKQSFAHLMANPKPFMYGTHFSTPGYVVSFLLRSKPLYFLKLQGGAFDKPERLFQDIHASYQSALHSPADVRELIPQFYDIDGLINDQPNSTSTSNSSSLNSSLQSNPTAFLSNYLHLDLGITQSGREISNVELPNWASNEYEFISIMRRALESDYVSQHLHLWIDLIWGYAQQGEEAVKHDNLFFPLTYEGVIDLDLVTDEKERMLIETQMVEFGQTPKQLFLQPHPAKYIPVHTIQWEKLIRDVQKTNSLCWSDAPLLFSSSTTPSSQNVEKAHNVHNSNDGNVHNSTAINGPYPASGSLSSASNSGTSVPSLSLLQTNGNYSGVVIEQNDLVLSTKLMPKDVKQRRANKLKQQQELEQKRLQQYQQKKLLEQPPTQQPTFAQDFVQDPFKLDEIDAHSDDLHLNGQNQRNQQNEQNEQNNDQYRIPSERMNSSTSTEAYNNNNSDDDQFMTTLLNELRPHSTQNIFHINDNVGVDVGVDELTDKIDNSSHPNDLLQTEFSIDENNQDQNEDTDLNHDDSHDSLQIDDQDTYESTQDINDKNITPPQMAFLSFSSTSPSIDLSTNANTNTNTNFLSDNVPILRFSDIFSTVSTGNGNIGTNGNTTPKNNDNDFSTISGQINTQSTLSGHSSPLHTPEHFQTNNIEQSHWANDFGPNYENVENIPPRQRTSTLIDINYNITPSTEHPDDFIQLDNHYINHNHNDQNDLEFNAINTWSKSPHTHTPPIKIPSKINTICVGSKYTIGLTKEDNIVRIFRTHTLQLIIQHKVSTLPLISCTLLDTDGSECLLGDNEGILYIYNVDSGAIAQKFNTQHNNILQLFSTLTTPQTMYTTYKRLQQMNSDQVQSSKNFQLSFDGLYNDLSLSSLDQATSTAPLILTPPPPINLYIATNGADCSVKIWSLTRSPSSTAPASLNLSGNLMLASSGNNITDMICSSFHYTQKHEIVNHNTPLAAAAFTPDNKHILTLDEDFLVLFTNIVNGDEIFQINLNDHLDLFTLQQQQQQRNKPLYPQNTQNIPTPSAHFHTTIFFPSISQPAENFLYPTQELLQQYRAMEYYCVIILHKFNLGLVLGQYGDFITQFDISFSSLPSTLFTPEHPHPHPQTISTSSSSPLSSSSTSSSHRTSQIHVPIVNIIVSGNMLVVGYSNGFLRCYQYNHQNLLKTNNTGTGGVNNGVLVCLWQKQISTALITFEQSIFSQQLPYIDSTIYSALHSSSKNKNISHGMYTQYKTHYSMIAILHGQSSQSYKMCLFAPMIRRRDDHNNDHE